MIMEQANFRRLSTDSSEIHEAASHLRRGGIVAFPTETVYGLGANAAKQAAVEALFALKQRPSDHPLIIHVSGLADASSWAKLNPLALRVIGALWPGPLSLVLPRRPAIPMHALAAQKTVALRCPSHPVARALLSQFSAIGGKGVAAPSANPYGKLSPTDPDHVESDMRRMMHAHASRRLRLSDPKLPDCWMIDGGPSDAGIESTVLDLSTDEPRVLRPGVISREQLESILGMPIPLIKPQAIEPKAQKRSTLLLPKSSGTLLSHYAPNKPLYVLDESLLAAKLAELHEQGCMRLALWGVEEKSIGDYEFEISLDLGALPDAPELIAQLLYRQLRSMDESAAEALIVVLPSPIDMLSNDKAWEAVIDRIERASYATKHGLISPKAVAKSDPVGHDMALPADSDMMFDAFEQPQQFEQTQEFEHAPQTPRQSPQPSPPQQPSPGEDATDDLDFDMSFDDLGANP